MILTCGLEWGPIILGVPHSKGTHLKKLSVKWEAIRGGARLVSFGIIGHQKHNWEWNFTKTETTGIQTSFFPPILVVNWDSSPLSFFLSASSTAAARYIFTAPHLYNYYNYSRTLCIKCWVSAFHFWDVMKIFVTWQRDHWNKGHRGWKRGWWLYR